MVGQIVFIRYTVPHQRMALYVMADCPKQRQFHGQRPTDADSGLTISAITYSPLSSLLQSNEDPTAYPITFAYSADATTELDAGFRPQLDLLQHPEYFGFAEWVGDDNFPIEDMTLMFVEEQLQVCCFPEFQRRSPRNYNTGFYVNTVYKFAASYGSWGIRAKLPFQVPASMSIGLFNSRCTIPSCPPDARRPVTFTQMDPSPGKDIAFEVAE
ncbi:hypothetical protein RvY_10440 [Ramazzottius varieornatus]|uniref:Uncharacterized protein n=1 Tax=Ramazzottius varieornatus TaxID=947166 RepID=A0A1D1VF79_RAMVA|nr:hypothetical protein RvY_10440 [Ramazzottius varieornatus]